MAKVRLLGNSGYHLNINLKGANVDAVKNSYGAYGVKTADLVALGLDKATFAEDTVYFVASSVEVLED